MSIPARSQHPATQLKTNTCVDQSAFWGQLTVATVQPLLALNGSSRPEIIFLRATEC